MVITLPDVTVWETIGLSGAALYTLSYFLTAYDRLPSQSPLYYLCKLSAACLVLVSLTEKFNLASAVIQVVFISVSMVGIARHMDARRRSRFVADPLHAPYPEPSELERTATVLPVFRRAQASTADRNCRKRSDFGAPNSTSGAPSSSTRP